MMTQQGMTYSMLVLQSQSKYICLVIAIKVPNVPGDFGIHVFLKSSPGWDSQQAGLFRYHKLASHASLCWGLSSLDLPLPLLCVTGKHRILSPSAPAHTLFQSPIILLTLFKAQLFESGCKKKQQWPDPALPVGFQPLLSCGSSIAFGERHRQWMSQSHLRSKSKASFELC